MKKKILLFCLLLQTVAMANLQAASCLHDPARDNGDCEYTEINGRNVLACVESWMWDDCYGMTGGGSVSQD
jgi:hypothetical protein